jgi:hypothetical protein
MLMRDEAGTHGRAEPVIDKRSHHRPLDSQDCDRDVGAGGKHRAGRERIGQARALHQAELRQVPVLVLSARRRHLRRRAGAERHGQGRRLREPGRNWIICQASGATVHYHGYHNGWWGYTEANDHNMGWVNAVYASGGSNKATGSSHTTRSPAPKWSNAHAAQPASNQTLSQRQPTSPFN